MSYDLETGAFRHLRGVFYQTCHYFEMDPYNPFKGIRALKIVSFFNRVISVISLILKETTPTISLSTCEPV